MDETGREIYYSSKNLTYNSSLTDYAKRNHAEDDSEYCLYKKMFDQSSAHYGVAKPPMGGAGYTDMILGGASKSDLNSLDIAHLSQKPLVNLLSVSEMQRRGMLTRYLYYIYYTSSRPINYHYPSINKMKRSVLKDEKLNRAVLATIEQNKSDNSDHASLESQVKTLRRKTVSIVDEMLASVTSTSIRFCGWLFLTLLRKLTSAVHIHQGQIEVLKQVIRDDKPIIYFPLHFSHFDYILLTLVIYYKGLRVPFVASGNNLLIQPFSAIMRRVGGFFIRRKIDGNDRDLIYRAVLQSYITKLLEKRQSLEIFIEGTRSRSGLPNLPKTGLLAIAVESMASVGIEDITLVPVCISYEKLLEGTFRDELMGKSKKPETFVSSLVSIFKMLCGFYGHIRVNFGVPQSLVKTLKELGSSPSCAFSNQLCVKPPTLADQLPHPETVNCTNSSQTCSTDGRSTDYTSTGSSHHEHKTLVHNSSFNATNIVDQQSRELVTFLGERIVYNSLKCKVFMSTNLVSFLLLHRWRNGVTMSQLVESFRQLTMELFTKKSDVGFSGDYNEVVLHAITLLGSDLVELDCAYSEKIQRSSSNTSIRSKKSADSGYELEDAREVAVQAKLSPEKSPNKLSPEKSPNKLSPEKSAEKKLSGSGSDSGEEMYYSECEEPLTGSYMTASLSGHALSDYFSTSGLNKVQSTLLQQYCIPAVKPQSRINLTVFIEPVLRAPQVFDLAYYANALTPVFALESIAALAVNALTGYRLSTLEKKLHVLTERSTIEPIRLDADDLPDCLAHSFLRSQLIDKTLELVDLLQMDLILCDVTQNLELAVSDAVDNLATRNCLVVDEYGNSAATRKSLAAQELGFDEVDLNIDQWVKINLEQLPVFLFIQSVMSSYVEGYVAASSKLTCLLEYPLPEDVLTKEMLSTAQQRVNDGLATRNESCSSDIIRNAIRSFEWNGVLLRNEVFKKEIQLSSDFQNTESIANLVSRISQFLF